VKFIVTKYEVWAQPVEVEADTPDDAIATVRHERGKILEPLFEYSHDLSPDDWKTEAVPAERAASQ
jgi:hypothetical protein